MNSEALFTGAHVSRRPINLGGTGSTSASEDVITKARVEREQRERNRARARAAAHVQRVWRGRKGNELAKDGLRRRFDELALDSSASLSDAQRLLAAFMTPSRTQDMARAAAWARAAVTTKSLFSQFNEPTFNAASLNRLVLAFLCAAPSQPTAPQLPLLLEVTRMLCDTAAYAKNGVKQQPRAATVVSYLARHGALHHLAQLIRALPSPSKAVLSPTAHIVASVVKADPNTQSTVLFDELMTIDGLSRILPPAVLPTLSSLPWDTIAQTLELTQSTSPQSAPAILTNLLALTATTTFANGKAFVAYIKLVSLLVLAIPKETLSKQTSRSTTGSTKEVVIEHSDSESDEDDDALAQAKARLGTTGTDSDMTMTDAVPRVRIDDASLVVISTLASRQYLSMMLGLSNRFSASSRPAFASFVIAVLHAFPNRRDTILNTIMFGTTGQERGGGVLREIWRGYIRAGKLGHALAEKDRSATLLNATTDPQLASDWSLFILLSEMYSRSLLTMGDDEFFGAKNALTLDEVIGFSAMLRNLAFALYWQEGTNMAVDQLVVGTGLSVIALRSIATTLLQQIYARDSRKPFAPKGHWLMISQFDLASFIQTVVYEDQKLDSSDDVESAAAEQAPRPTARTARLALSKKQMAFVSPRLGILNNIPFVIPFENRVAIFRQFVQNDRTRLQIDPHTFDRRKRYRATVRRTHVSEDSFKQLNGLGAAIKYPIEIAFIDQHGLEEAGIDGGGLFKELLTSLSKEAFDTDRGLWLANKEQELYPNPHSYAREPNQLAWYAFIGRILGKALYEGILVDVRFASFFLAKWLGRQSYLDDLASLDPELYNGLIFLKNYAGDVEKDLSLNFTVTEEEFGVSRTIDLIPNGSETPVTNENRIQYIYMTSHYRLNRQIERQCSAFFRGLSEVIPERFLRLFNQDELRVLVGGVDKPIDLDDLEQHTVYGGFDGNEANETVRLFWDVVRSFDADERAKLVKFATSCARPPLLGFRELNPYFAIRAAGNDTSRLPSSSTCVNLLKLPEYKDRETLRQKLLYAINSGAGFDLS